MLNFIHLIKKHKQKCIDVLISNFQEQMISECKNQIENNDIKSEQDNIFDFDYYVATGKLIFLLNFL